MDEGAPATTADSSETLQAAIEALRRNLCWLANNLGSIEHKLPALHPPLPIFAGIQHDQWPPSRSGRSVIALILFGRKREIAGEAWQRVAQQLVLFRKWQLGESIERFQGQRDACKFALIESIRGENSLEQLVECLQLMRSQFASVAAL